MAEAREVVERLVAAGEVVYGVTTGFGDLAGTYIEPAMSARLQENLLLSHAVGVGDPLPRDVVRAMLLLRANTLALGHSGCRSELVDRLCELLRSGIHPVVPSQGSVGASGDLAPLAHLALPLTGRGYVEVNGRVVAASEALRAAGLEPLTLQAKEGLALLNGTQMMSAIGALVAADAARLSRTASVAAAMSCEAMLGTDVAYASAYQLARPHPGQIAVAEEMRWLLRESSLMASHHASSHKVQDPYSLRCVPQVHGAVRDALEYLRGVLDVELNSATDNPLVFPQGGVADPSVAATGGGLVISGGNFHGEPVALALDFAKLAISELGSISERRIALMLDPRLNCGLPPFLSSGSGLESGMMLLQYTAAALASENKVLAHPASADSIPTSANMEDHVSMGSIAARHAMIVVTNVQRILALELLVAAQALDFRLEELRKEQPRIRAGMGVDGSPRPTAIGGSPSRPRSPASLGHRLGDAVGPRRDPRGPRPHGLLIGAGQEGAGRRPVGSVTLRRAAFLGRRSSGRSPAEFAGCPRDRPASSAQSAGSRRGSPAAAAASSSRPWTCGD